ncbi:MAG: mercuric ion transporter MerT [Acidobacteriota bacterium]
MTGALRKEKRRSETRRGRGALFVGGLAAILASTCCLGPLVLLMLGISGAWIANLTALEPYRPIFIGVAAVALFFSYRHIFRPAVACRPGEVCAVPEVHATFKALFGVVVVLLLIAVSYPLFAPFFY